MVQLFQRRTTATAGTSGGALTANLPLKSAAQRAKIHAEKMICGVTGVTGVTATTTGGGGGGIGGV